MDDEAPIPTDPVTDMYARGEIVRGAPLDEPVIPHQPKPGTARSEEIISDGRR